MSHAGYYPGAEPMSLKLLFDPDDGTILGAQAVGGDGVDKRIDVLATAMTAASSADELADLELAYAPPFSSAKDPVNMLGYMAENVLSGACDVVEPDELGDVLDAGWTLVDVRTPAEHAKGSIPQSINLPLDPLREDIASVGDGPFVVYCEVGQRGHTATSLLHELGLRPATSTAATGPGWPPTPPVPWNRTGWRRLRTNNPSIPPDISLEMKSPAESVSEQGASGGRDRRRSGDLSVTRCRLRLQ